MIFSRICSCLTKIYLIFVIKSELSIVIFGIKTLLSLVHSLPNFPFPKAVKPMPATTSPKNPHPSPQSPKFQPN